MEINYQPVTFIAVISHVASNLSSVISLLLCHSSFLSYSWYYKYEHKS